MRDVTLKEFMHAMKPVEELELLVEIPAEEAIVIIAGLQIALKHPLAGVGYGAGVMRAFIERISAPLIAASPAMARVIEDLWERDEPEAGAMPAERLQ